MEQATELIQKKEHITKDWTMGEIVQKYPAAVEIMSKYGLHCFGCHVSTWETLEQGILGHGGSSQDVEKMVNEMNQILEEEQTQSTNTEILLTDKAVNKIKNLIDSNQDITGLRIAVIPGGCSGFSYEFSLVKSPKEDERTIHEKEINIYINQESINLIRGSKIDYIEALQGAGFKVSNPNATSTCGCGQSFS